MAYSNKDFENFMQNYEETSSNVGATVEKNLDE